MSKIIVGGTEMDVPVLKFKALKGVWPEIQKMQAVVLEAKDSGDVSTLDAMAMADVATKIIAMALSQSNPEHNQDWLEENLDINEVPQLGPVMLDMLIESGLVNRAEADKQSRELGNAMGKAANLSTETSTPSSQNSSQPDAQEETGTP